MATNLKVSGTQGYLPYREVEPVPPYPRIDPQRQRDEYPPAQGEQRGGGNEHARRRFDAMRRLIDELTKDSGISRVDYPTAVRELTELGFSILDTELLKQLSGLNFFPDDIREIIEQISQQRIFPELNPGQILSESLNFFPVFISGINEYNLCFPPLHIPVTEPLVVLVKAVESQGYYISERNRLRLEFRFGDDATVRHADLVVTISVLVGGSEIDEGGRRVILYQQSGQGYALYADKQIDLSI